MDRNEVAHTLQQVQMWGEEMEAFRNGETVQVRAGPCWVDDDNPSFHPCNEYRVKPQPERWSRWANDYGYGPGRMWETREEAEEYAGETPLAVHRFDYERLDGEISYVGHETEAV